jgi:hypothetical protein
MFLNSNTTRSKPSWRATRTWVRRAVSDALPGSSTGTVAAPSRVGSVGVADVVVAWVVVASSSEPAQPARAIAAIALAAARDVRTVIPGA